MDSMENDWSCNWWKRCFLTKKAAVDYLNKFGHLHQNPKILGLTAAANEELEYLLSIIQKVDWQYIYKKLKETDYYEE